MPITELLEANAKKYPNEESRVEINPDMRERRRVTWMDWKRGQSGDFIDELLGMASDLFWYIKDRSTGGAA